MTKKEERDLFVALARIEEKLDAHLKQNGEQKKSRFSTANVVGQWVMIAVTLLVALFRFPRVR